LEDETCHLMDFDLYGHLIAFVEVFLFADTRLDRHEVAAIFGEQGSSVLGFTNPHMDGNHAPAVGHEAGDGFYRAAVLGRNRDEKPRGGSAPEDDPSAELDVHGWSISNAE